jgi:hypothetical protein
VTTEQMNAVMAHLVNLTRDSAPVTVSIGYIDAANTVRHDGIKITNAPASVTQDIIVFVSAMRHRMGQRYVDASIHGGGLLIA